MASCSREQADAAASAIGQSYHLSYRDGVIKNWQAGVANHPHCAHFKEMFKSAGERYDNAANGKFMNDMMKIREQAKSAGCTLSG